MNKVELATEIAARLEVPVTHATAHLNAAIDVITEQLVARKEVSLLGFGIFRTGERKARVVANPKDRSQLVDVPAQTVPTFRAGKKLKTIVNNGK